MTKTSYSAIYYSIQIVTQNGITHYIVSLGEGFKFFGLRWSEKFLEVGVEFLKILQNLISGDRIYYEIKKGATTPCLITKCQV